ncbi:uncharacterized protein PV09_05842 [Verruconis gallopava]|uniref:1,3-beta-glucanosyltransferase n=1 Tax=Verruconis gallopava TaxID=253628 RepID=A0A0D2A863_9PEZI|nr:uncharacterized protein PV09_05842 [Verruconis gallopava]KIW02780.1 hypothetical protein PV09_05842 [Verruconis gallopava]
MAQLGLLLATSLLVTLASAVEFITVSGGNFITNSTGKRFSIIGVDYQPGGSSGFSTTADPLSDATTCLRDAIMMQQLGVNTIRVYNVDANLDHSECASIFNAAGIYMIIDVNSGLYGTYIDRTDPASTYTLQYLEHVFGVMENFAPFPNTLGFFAGNEILNQNSSYEAPMYIRAVVRDMKDYASHNLGRSIGVGYSAADVDTMLSDTWNYLGCDLANSSTSNIDFFGLNDYEWCGDSSFTQSGYNKLVELFSGTSIPVFFSEYGCNQVEPRTFTNVPVLYGSEMSVLSGGLVYEYSEEGNNYGLVDINSTSELTVIVDYNYLQEELSQLDIKSLQSINSSATAAAATSCAPSLITETNFLNAWDLPTPPSGAAAMITSGVSTGFVKGSVVAVTETTMPATVVNNTGSTITGLSLVQLMCTDSNYPGLIKDYTSTSVSCNYATPGPSASATKKSAADKLDVRATSVMLAALVMLLTLL